jgi:SAM-dependent methyltransferase
MKPAFHVVRNALGFREIAPKPSKEALARHYAEKYYQEPSGSYASSYSADELRYFNNVAKVAEFTASRLGVERSVLDLGCGEGFFAAHFQARGWETSCCDFSSAGLTRHNPALLPYLLVGDVGESILSLHSKSLTFGLVNMQNVLEHVIDPLGTLASIRSLLGSGSCLRIRVPNDFSDFQRALVESGQTTESWVVPPDHLSYFNRHGLESILQAAGYKIVSVQADFPIEIFLANPHSNYWRDRTIGKGAHAARVFCENYLIEKDMEAYVDYSECAARLGFGRELIAYAVPRSP